MKISAVAVGLTAVMCASACSSSSSSHPSSSSRSSSSTSSSTSSSPPSSGSDAALLAQIKPLPGAGQGWVVRDAIVGYGSDAIVVSDENEKGTGKATKLTGLSPSDGHQVWTLDLTKAPKGLTLSSDGPQFHQIGSSLTVAWTGTSSGDALNTGTPTTETAVYDLNTGQRRGSVLMRAGGPGDLDTPLAYGYKDGSQDGKAQYLLQDGTLDSNTDGLGSGVSSTYDAKSASDSPVPASIHPTPSIEGPTISAQDVDADTAIWTWADASTQSPMAVFVHRKTRQLIGSPVSCVGGMGYYKNLNSLDQRQIQVDSFIVDTKTHAVSCFKPSTNSLDSVSVASDGTAYFVANSHLFSMKPGASNVQPVPVSNALPDGVLSHAALYSVNDASTGQRYTVVFPTK